MESVDCVDEGPMTCAQMLAFLEPPPRKYVGVVTIATEDLERAYAAIKETCGEADRLRALIRAVAGFGFVALAFWLAGFNFDERGLMMVFFFLAATWMAVCGAYLAGDE